MADASQQIVALLREEQAGLVSRLLDAQDNLVASCSECLSLADRHILFQNWNSILAAHQELAELIKSNVDASLTTLGPLFVNFLFFSNFIEAHSSYVKGRAQASSLVHQLALSNSAFKTLLEECKGRIHSANDFDKILAAPLVFVSKLRTAINTAIDKQQIDSKDAKVWSGISKNLQSAANREDEEAQARRNAENKLFQLELRILDLPEKIHQPGRYLVLETTVGVAVTNKDTIGKVSPPPNSSAAKMKTHEMVILLTNDLMVLMKRSKRQKGMFEHLYQHFLRTIVSLDLLPPPEGQYVRVQTLDSVYHLKFENQADAEAWVIECTKHTSSNPKSSVASPPGSPSVSPLPARRPGTMNFKPGSAAYKELEQMQQAAEKAEKANKAKIDAISASSDREDSPELAAKKKRSASSTTTAGSKKRTVSNPAQDGANDSSVITVRSGSPSKPPSGRIAMSPSSPNTEPAKAERKKSSMSTEAKRSSFTKSVSVSTISSSVVKSKLKKDVGDSSFSGSGRALDAITEWPVRMEKSPSTDQASMSASSPTISPPPQRRKKRTESAAVAPTPKTLELTGTASTASSGRTVSPKSKADSSLDEDAPTSLSSSGSKGPTREASKKYLLHPVPSALPSLDDSSDYEESEDEPARLSKINGGKNGNQSSDNSFFKPAPRDFLLSRYARSSASTRELSSGSIEDLSARDPPSAETKNARIQVSKSSTSVASSDRDSSPAPFSSASEFTSSQKPDTSPSSTSLNIPLIVSTISRLESELATLKGALAAAGIHC